MKICHFIASSLFGGAEKVVVNLCNEMSKDHEVHLITFDSRENLGELSSHVVLHTIKEFKRYNIFALLKLLKLIRNIGPDIVHTHGAKSTRIIYNIGYKLECPFIGTKHNARKGKIFNKIKYVIAVSEDGANSIKQNNIKVIYNGIKPIQITSKNKNEIFTLLAVGRLDKIKGFDILIKECAKLDFPFRLEIVGEGEERKNLETLIHKLNLGDKVILLGFKEDIPQQMKNADIVVMSSHSEGFSLVMVEALFYANMFISTRVSGATEILDDEFLIKDFSIADKLNEIYQDEEKYKKDFFLFREKINNRFLLKHIAQEYITYYKNVLKDYNR
ncbi:Poly(glycerol-phosphate) alpha-glucosyltransferase [hydrothermal vent metagenome]|uniref:Poly(Glycerol-phosphate) alpha-glucosyltransferase n=1 Tax=hydrothermal vent metagenome TaxID=652676 RepID=A0A1W1CUW7_9ZZZZ